MTSSNGSRECHDAALQTEIEPQPRAFGDDAARLDLHDLA